MTKIGFGIIGYGRIGPRHHEKIAANPDCDLVAVCDTDAARLAKVDNPSANLYSDYQDLIADVRVDVVSVCSPNYLHAPMTIAALEAGKHVLCEKPMALTTSDCLRMTDAARQSKRKLLVVKQNRYNPPVAAVKQLLDEDRFGRIHAVALNCYWNRDTGYYAGSDWKGVLEKDGGALFTQFSHFVDLLYWFGGAVTKVSAQVRNLGHPGISIEDTGGVVLEFASGAVGTITFTNNAFRKNMEGSVTLFAERGTVKIGGEYLNILEYQEIEGLAPLALPRAAGANDYGTYKGSMSNHHLVYENLAGALLRNDTIHVDGTEGMQTVKILEAIYKAAGTGTIIEVEHE